jgi:hypothetical protein
MIAKTRCFIVAAGIAVGASSAWAQNSSGPSAGDINAAPGNRPLVLQGGPMESDTLPSAPAQREGNDAPAMPGVAPDAAMQPDSPPDVIILIPLPPGAAPPGSVVPAPNGSTPRSMGNPDAVPVVKPVEFLKA